MYSWEFMTKNKEYLAFFPFAMVLFSTGVGERSSGQSHVTPVFNNKFILKDRRTKITCLYWWQVVLYLTVKTHHSFREEMGFVRVSSSSKMLFFNWPGPLTSHRKKQAKREYSLMGLWWGWSTSMPVFMNPKEDIALQLLTICLCNTPVQLSIHDTMLA